MQYQCQAKEEEPSQQTLFTDQGNFEVNSLAWVTDIFKKFPSDTCETSTVNLFTWGPTHDYNWFLYKGRFLIYDGRHKYLLMPVGCPMDPEDLYGLAQHMMNMGLCPRICQVPKAYLAENPEIYDYFTVAADRDGAEYVYKTRNLINLDTQKLHKKKNLVSQFHRKYPDFTVVPLDSALQDRCLDFARQQLDAMAQVPKSLEDEFSAMKQAFALWTCLCPEGLAVMVQDRIAAFAVFSRLNKTTFDIHFEKFSLDFKGASQVINQETAKYLEGRCTYINREQDLGIAGLRQAKLSYEPYRLLVPHTLKLKTSA
jgi:hypothetical protein